MIDLGPSQALLAEAAVHCQWRSKRWCPVDRRSDHRWLIRVPSPWDRHLLLQRLYPALRGLLPSDKRELSFALGVQNCTELSTACLMSEATLDPEGTQTGAFAAWK